MSTTLTYNGVTIANVQTLEFDQSCVYDESNTDLLYHQFRIRVEGTVHTQAARSVRVIPQGTSAADTHLSLETALMHPRAYFVYAIGGENVLEAGPVQPNLDVNHGPKPKSLRIVQVLGTKALRIQYEIEVAVVKCGNTSRYNQLVYGARAAPQQAVLNNRWSLTETKDQDFYTERTWEGILRVAHSSIWPHAMRYLVVPPLQNTYRRTGMRFVQSADALTLRYQITDKQQHASPPPPATSWTATQTETLGGTGAVGFTNLNIRMKGGPDSDKGGLLAAAASVVFARVAGLQKSLTKAGQNANCQAWPKEVVIVESLSESEIELRATIQRITTGSNRWLNVPWLQVGQPLPIAGYNPKIWPAPLPYDSTSPSGIFATYLQSPCSNYHGITGVTPLPAPPPVIPTTYRDPGPTNETGTPTTPIKNDSPDGQSTDQKGNNPYSFVEIDSIYETKTGHMHLPVARFNPNAMNSKAATSVFIPFHQGICRRVFKMRAERVGDWPKLPKPVQSRTDPNGITETLLDTVIIPNEPKLQADGKTLLYCIQAKYIYGLDRVPTEKEKLISAVSPIDSLKPPDGIYDLAKYTTTGEVL